MLRTQLLLLAALAGSSQSPIVPPDAKLEKLFDGGLVLTEGVAVAPDGMVYFSDITFSHVSREKLGRLEAGHIWRFDPNTGKTSIFRSPSGMSNGLKFDADGNLLAAEGADFGGRRVTRTDMRTGKSTIVAGLFEGRPFNAPNDITLDEKGRIYFSDPRYLGHEPIDQPVMAVYRIDPDGSVHRIITDAGKPNGVCVSPDQKTLYVVSNDNGSTGIGRVPASAPLRKGRMALLAYDLAADGSAKFRKVLVDYAPQDGPDGLVCDAEGNVYVTVRDETRPGICVYSPEGKELAYIPTELPTNVGFGRGKEARTLYITAGRSLYRIRLNKEGYQLPARTK
jgi:gluconolactonase